MKNSDLRRERERLRSDQDYRKAWFVAKMEEFGETLYWHACQLTTRDADAQDLFQDTLARAWERLDSLKGTDSATFQGWLLRIQRNIAFRRRDWRLPMPLDEALVAPPAENLDEALACSNPLYAAADFLHRAPIGARRTAVALLVGRDRDEIARLLVVNRRKLSNKLQKLQEFIERFDAFVQRDEEIYLGNMRLTLEAAHQENRSIRARIDESRRVPSEQSDDIVRPHVSLVMARRVVTVPKPSKSTQQHLVMILTAKKLRVSPFSICLYFATADILRKGSSDLCALQLLNRQEGDWESELDGWLNNYIRATLFRACLHKDWTVLYAKAWMELKSLVEKHSNECDRLSTFVTDSLARITLEKVIEGILAGPVDDEVVRVLLSEKSFIEPSDQAVGGGVPHGQDPFAAYLQELLDTGVVFGTGPKGDY